MKNYFLLLALCFLSSMNAQIINIPDANFKAKLLEADVVNWIAMDKYQNPIKIDSNDDGEIQQTEALEVCYLAVDYADISSLTGIENFNNLIELSCFQNKLIALDVSLLTKLESLVCGDNQLENLNVLELSNLRVLDCAWNKLTSLDLSGQNSDIFDTLYCSQNMITNLDLGKFNKLVYLYCENNELTSLNVTAYNTLEGLGCSNIKNPNFDITKFSNLLGLMYELDESTVLDLSKFIRLERLVLSGKQLTSIDLSPLKDLWDLWVGGDITSLDITKNPNLTQLVLQNSKITEIDLSQSKNLKWIYINDTQIKSIDLSNLSSLESFSFNRNPLLETLFAKNGIIETIYYLSDNPNLKYVCADEDQITQIENLLKESGHVDFTVNSYCSFAPAGENFTIQGNMISDSDNNGCDTNDVPASFLKLEISDGTKTGRLIANETGSYVIKVPAGSYTITPVFENPEYFSVSPASLQVEFPTVTSPLLQDFCITPVDSHKDLEVTLLPITVARPGFTADYKISFKNKGNVAQSGNVNLLFKDSVLDLMNANPAVSSEISNNLSWNFTILKPFETREIALTFKVNSPIQTPAVLNGDILNFTATVSSSETDEKPLDNTFVLNQTVVGSYDPNDKTCLEGEVITPELIGKYVHYMIRFENTGTYAAENVVVKDLIDLSKFDIATLTPTSASHSYTTKISEGNKVEFIFENINLPFDDASNDGYIAFKIKTLPTLSVGDSFTNEANIYFDYNFPILTNTAKSTFNALSTQDFEFSNYFNIYPVPANNKLNLVTKHEIKIQSLSVYDVFGQLLIAVTDAKSVSDIDVSKLRSGNYILKITTDKGDSGIKFNKI